MTEYDPEPYADEVKLLEDWTSPVGRISSYQPLSTQITARTKAYPLSSITNLRHQEALILDDLLYVLVVSIKFIY